MCNNTRASLWLEALGFELRRCDSCGHRYAAEVLAAESLSHNYYEEPEEDLAGRSSRAKEMRFSEYQQLLGDVFALRGKVLDVDCNTGELLWLFQQAGWNVHGVEVSPGPAAYAAKQLQAPIHCGTFEDFDVEPGSFDLVTLTHVLEHMPDPRATLGKLRELTRTGGSLLLEVPNADDAMLPFFGGLFRPLCPGDHVSFFGPFLRASSGQSLRKNFATLDGTIIDGRVELTSNGTASGTFDDGSAEFSCSGTSTVVLTPDD